ncbi:MAG: sulfotransferase [Dehalococcoidia bacterium]|nr:sulfotransferase [Dehalococcoidia bacterium]
MSVAIGEDGENLGFLFGLPRSGTTLLSVMLAGHPEIHCPPEPWVALAAEAIGRVHPAHPADAGILGEALDAFVGTARDDAARAYLRAVYRAHLAASGKRFFLDKTPRYYHVLGFLERLFPAARRVVLLRNPLDIAASYRESWGIDVVDLLRQAPGERACLDYVLGWQRLTALAASGAVTTIRYEELVATPGEQLERVLRALDVPVLRGLEHFEPAGSAFAASALGDRKVLETTVPHTASVGRWRMAFSAADLQLLLEAAGAEALRAAGYGAIVEELAARGVVSGGEEVTAGWRRRVEEELAARTALLAAAARTAPGLTLGQPLNDMAARVESLQRQAAELTARADVLADRAKAAEQQAAAASRRDHEAREALALAQAHAAAVTAAREEDRAGFAAERNAQQAHGAALVAERDALATENVRLRGELASVHSSRVWRAVDAGSRACCRLRGALNRVAAWLRR